MHLWDDERGQAIQIGAVLLFGALIIAFSTYQAFVVPDQNRQIEFNHNQEVQRDIQDVRNTIISLSGTQIDVTSVSLGTEYPSRAVFQNPGPPTGSLRTLETTNASWNTSIQNATSQGEVSDFWDGSTHRYPTGALVYQPNYNEFTQAPTTFYENSIVFSQYREQNITLTGQTIVDDESISLVTLNGTLSESRASSYNLQTRPLSVSDTEIGVESQSENLTITFPTRLDAESWRELLDGEFVTQSGHVEGIRTDPLGGPYRLLHIDLEPGVEYDLQLRKVGVGTGTSGTSESYIIPVEGNMSTVPEGGTGRIVAEVRDAYNNPIDGQSVNASASLPGGSVTRTTRETSSTGRVVFEYNAPQDISGVAQRTEQVNVSYAYGSPNLNQSDFQPRDTPNMTVQITVRNADDSGLTGGGGGNGAYAVDWEDPTQTGVTCTNGAEGTCTVDASQTAAAGLTVTTSPTADGASVSYSVSNQTVGVVSPTSGTTTAAGTDSTTFRPAANGSVNVYATSGAGGDTLDVEVINVFRNLLGETGVVTHEQTTAGQWREISFSNSYTDPVVVARPLSFDDEAPATVRVRDVTADSFEFRVDEPGETVENGFDTVDDVHGEEQFAYWVMESGTHTIDGDVMVDVGTAQDVPGVADTGGTQQVVYNQSFDSTPVVFSQTQTFNDPVPVVTRQWDIDQSGYEVGLQQAEPNQEAHGAEDVGYIAIEQTQAENQGVLYEAGSTGNTVEGVDNYGSSPPDVGETIDFQQPYGSSPVFIAQQQTLEGPNTGWVRYGRLSAANVDIAIDEDLNDDSERSHTTEIVGYFAIGSGGPIYANESGSGSGGSGGGGGTDTTPPNVNSASATAENTNNNANDVEQVDFAFDTSDTDSAIDRVLLRVFGTGGGEIASATVNSATSSSEVLTFTSQNMNNKEISVNITAVDTSGNSRICTGTIGSVGQTINDGGGLDCTQTNP